VASERSPADVLADAVADARAVDDLRLTSAADDSARFEVDICFLRARGCRCILRWDAARAGAIPATVCEETQSHGLCASRLDASPAIEGTSACGAS